MVTSKLEQLKSMSVVVADTGDLEAVRKFVPQDCTTNPSIVLKALQSPAFATHFDEAVGALAGEADAVTKIADRLTIDVGAALAELVPGRVSTEVDADLSFDAVASEAKAKAIIEAYAARGISKDRILIKLAATWEGITAARALQKAGIDCNLTLVFSQAQAIACADAGSFLISPFVGRITDWFSKSTGQTYTPDQDPGVASVRSIYEYFKAHNISTIVMGASFRHTGQIEALAGCDRLTIAPALLEQLAADNGELPRALDGANGSPAKIELTEVKFRWALNEDAMATEKLSEGIRNFNADTKKLYALINEKIAAR
jgi:transaldolase